MCHFLVLFFIISHKISLSEPRRSAFNLTLFLIMTGFCGLVGLDFVGWDCGGGGTSPI